MNMPVLDFEKVMPRLGKAANIFTSLSLITIAFDHHQGLRWIFPLTFLVCGIMILVVELCGDSVVRVLLNAKRS
jgi:hypothetical protein